MKYYTISPSKKLAEYVRFFWVLESEDPPTPYIYRSMADSCAELIFHYKGRFDEITPEGDRVGSFRSGIHSQTDRYNRFITEERFGVFGVYLYPFAVGKLLHLSPRELTGQMPDLHSALGKSGKELEEKIMVAPDNKIRCQILTEFLEKRLSGSRDSSHPVISAVRYIVHSKKNHTVQELARHFNLSERQFHRKFREYAGLTPKKFMRIVRFGDACNYYSDIDNRSLTDIALECGYYDQSHFIKDFKAFSGYHPGKYFSGNAEGIEWREEGE